MMRAYWMIACSAIAMAAASPGTAQTADATAQETASAAGHGVGASDIVVTARRREERLNDVPVAVTALGNDTLKAAQVATPKELSQFVPSLNVNTGNVREGNRYTLRGQGATLAAGEAVVTYLAEAPVPYLSAGAAGMIFDLENVQVLNGPQGTLFGRNTTGGAVLFTPRAPNDVNGGYIEGGYGNYNNREFSGAFNVAIVPDKVMLRVAGTWRQRDGFTHNVLAGARQDRLDDLNYYGLRATLLVKPADWLENSTIVQRSQSNPNGTAFFIEQVNPTPPAFKAALDAAFARQQQLGRREVENNPTFYLQRTTAAINTTTLSLSDDMRLKNIFSYFVSRSKNGFDIDGSAITGLFDEIDWPAAANTSANGLSNEKYLTEELQFSGEFFDRMLTVQAGGFYLDYKPNGYSARQYVLFGGRRIQGQGEAGTSKALYAQSTLNLGAFTPALDGLRLTAGYRYTWDRKQAFIDTYNTATNACISRPTGVNPNCRVDYADSWSKGTYTLGIDYKVTPDIMVYATTRHGYKSGGFNTNADPEGPFAAFIAFNPETITDYEVGLKAAYRAGNVRLNTTLAAYTANYSDIQRTQTIAVPGTPPSVTNLVTNAAAGKISGVELQQVVSIGGFTLDGNVSYMDAHYKKFILPGNIDISGQELPYSPKWKWGLNASYQMDTGAGDLTVRAGYSWSGTVRFNDPAQPGNFFGGYGLMNASATLTRVAGSPLDIDLYMTNVLNKTYVQQRTPYYYAFGFVSAFYTEPRMYGFRLRYNFD
ncbi:TonB-dependent receptor [Novosphingobium sp. Chol11]|jgi:iron complex outermembrane recepter protein|uniref:TonB-dependent receptor n=1 Tax=Novosphingobium sp. Chol11 TaxID=1385763 RepID=UPI000BE34756|nr:TonB-dependent receptor [Novosphingobium sp. Chol11]